MIDSYKYHYLNFISDILFYTIIAIIITYWNCILKYKMSHYSYGLFRKLAIHKCTCVCKCLGLSSILSIIQHFSSCVYLLCILFILLCAIFLLPLEGPKLVNKLNWIELNCVDTPSHLHRQFHMKYAFHSRGIDFQSRDISSWGPSRPQHIHNAQAICCILLFSFS